MNNLADYLNILAGYGRGDNTHVRSLPGFAYTSRDILSIEETLLRAEWLCIGREDEIPQPGDFFATELLAEPLLVVRGDDRTVRVLANVCRHRHMRVATGSGNVKNFVCPYHAWCYGRDGRLLKAPRIDANALSENDLAGLPVHHHTLWNGFIYVNLDGAAAPLAPQLAALEPALENYHTAQMHHVFVSEETWQVNWKCLVENFMEGYHLSVVHPETLHHITPTALCKKSASASAFTAYKAHYPKKTPNRGECHPDLDDSERRCSTLFCVFPCHMASQAPSLLVYLTLQPDGVDAVKIRWGASTFEDNLPADEIDARIAHWRAINDEDRAKLEVLQSNLRSRHTAPGLLAPSDYEGTIADFYAYLAVKMPALASHRGRSFQMPKR